jgi:Flp pilus assembly protein TadB
MDWHWSPFMIPLGAFVVAIVAIVSGVMSEAHRQRLKADQRLAMVARGMNADDIEKLLDKSSSDGKRVSDPLRSLANTRRTAIVLISSGIGLILFFLTLFVVLEEHDVLSGAAIGLIPLAIGVGFVIDYQLQKRDLSRFGLEINQPD